ncbi:DUF4838 domain-containing protein [Proteiniphilum sp.]|uniref:DUF4838 domain-containing protein n=1 Tax=Proteiniphilum sp. TaxID=1926877 RepID=UPI002B221173|nr:DUF4838 domain-containing protein [Proteiniphilum sp.]MEA4918652.1 DUF4838 domain-containing protein [Proteiniphilum sp.]
MMIERNNPWLFIRLLICFLILFPGIYSCSNKPSEASHFQTRGIILDVNDLGTYPWPKKAGEVGINTIAAHITPRQVASFILSERGKQFLKECKEYGIEVEYELHAMADLLPRELFADDSTMFRMNEEGKRMADYNLCVHSEEALATVSRNAINYARILTPTTGRFFYWIDDGIPMCSCRHCKEYSDSEQALILENRLIKELRKEFGKNVSLAHLAYHNTIQAPVKVKPEEGIFLEFAPFQRTWEKPIRDVTAKRGDSHISHGDYLKYLEENLKVFPSGTAQILEYWLDVSLFSGWQKPARQLPWNKEVFLSDIDTYARYGIKHVTSFGVYMDSTYFNRYSDTSFLEEYGEGLKNYISNE